MMHVAVTWPASALTTNFGGYRVRRRPVRTPAARWELIAEIGVPAGLTAAQAEARLTEFHDFEAAGESEYTVTVVDARTGFESTPQTGTDVTAPSSRQATRLVSNAAPWVACETLATDSPGLDTADRTVVRELAGRDHAVTRTPIELPARTWSARWHTFGRTGDSDFAALRAAASTGETVAVVEPLGRKVVGTVIVKQAAEREGGHGWAVDVEVVETTRTADPAGYNVPARLGFDGVNDTVTVPDAAALDPAGAGFTAVWVGIADPATSKSMIAKGVPGVSDGWALGTDGTGNLVGVLDGVTGLATATGAAPSSDVACYALTTNGSNSHTVWVDGVAAGTSTTATGSVATAGVLCVGSVNAAASWAACEARAWGVWGRELSAAELVDVAAYFADRSADLPAGCVLLHDVADDRCWEGGTDTTLANLTGTAVSAGGTSLTGTIAGAVPVGDPWPFRLLDGEA